MKRIFLSVLVIAGIGGAMVAGTRAFFSDTETSINNTLAAGTIDISIDEENPWNKTFSLNDVKPGYTDYINFEIENTAKDANPVNIFKTIKVTNEETGIQSEPECIEENGTWNDGQKTCTGMTLENNHLSGSIWYDLSVEVFDSVGGRVWWQTIYVDSDHKSITDVYGSLTAPNEVFLGMIPAGGKMKVKQSYHLDDTVGNWAQGDIMTFDISVLAEQLQGEAKLENKTDAPDYKLVFGDGIEGTLTYVVKNPTFKYSFTGKVILPNTNYTLLLVNDPWPQIGSLAIGSVVSDGSGNVSLNGDVEINSDWKDKKVWLVLSSDWDGTQMTGWHQTDYLTETGLIWYEDTDL